MGEDGLPVMEPDFEMPGQVDENGMVTPVQRPVMQPKMAQVPVTIKGETRDIEFTVRDGQGKATSGPVFGCVKGHGTKVHRTRGTVWLKDGEWKFDFRSGYALNSGACLIVAFADTIADAAKSQHVGTKFAEEVK